MSTAAQALIPILYQDASVVVVNKPAWSVAHRTRGAAGAMVLVDALRQQLGAPVYTVHRLDRQTSGVLIFALTSEIASLLSDQVRARIWRKTYLGLCRGVIIEELRVDRGVPQGEIRRDALTEIRPLEHFCGRYTLVQATPRTGRRHQIRYHLRHISHPLVGDTNYGKGNINRFFRATFDLSRMFLHAESLSLPHPVENRTLQVDAPLPADLARVLQRLREYRGPVE